jgi:hypothetical protein
MSDEPKKPGIAVWATIAAVILMLGYLLSVGPVVLFARWEYIPESALCSAEYYCLPYYWIMQNSPLPVVHALSFYLGLWC